MKLPANREWDELSGWYDNNSPGFPSAETSKLPPDLKAGRGPVRLRCVPDECCDLAFLLGDTFNPAVNLDIDPVVLKEEEQREIARIDREGVWGIVAEAWNGEEWVHADSCWGFIGDDFKDYFPDAMHAAIAALKAFKHCPTCGRPERQKRYLAGG